MCSDHVHWQTEWHLLFTNRTDHKYGFRLVKGLDTVFETRA